MKTEKQNYYQRFSLAQRIEHIAMVLSFTSLGLTGLIQKFPLAAVSNILFIILGGVETVRIIHRVAAIVMILGSGYHIVTVGYRMFVLRTSLGMLPKLQDAKDGLQAFMYNLGRAKSRPQMGRYTFEEKMEYWAFVWGTVVMVVTGFMLWNPITTNKILPGEFIPAAKAAHGGEAILAVLAIIIWHFYGVHIKSFNKSMFTGKMSEEEMLHEHPLELADIKAGKTEVSIAPATLRKRQMIYLPVAITVVAVTLAALFYFVTVENTAPITTVPPASTVEVFVPRPTPEAPATPAVPAALTWDASIGQLLAGKCASCHGPAAVGGLNISTYAETAKGGKSGSGFLPGQSAESPLILIQEKGGHPGQFSPEEIARLREWIDNGAAEK